MENNKKKIKEEEEEKIKEEEKKTIKIQDIHLNKIKWFIENKRKIVQEIGTIEIKKEELVNEYKNLSQEEAQQIQIILELYVPNYGEVANNYNIDFNTGSIIVESALNI